MSRAVEREKRERGKKTKKKKREGEGEGEIRDVCNGDLMERERERGVRGLSKRVRE
jgi:hypothetical protein